MGQHGHNPANAVNDPLAVRRLSPWGREGQFALHTVLDVAVSPRTSPASPVADLVGSARRGDIRIDLFFGAFRGDQLVHAAVAVDTPGRAALVLMPSALRGPDAHAGAVAVLQALRTAATARGLALLQVLVRPNVRDYEPVLQAAGFRYLTRLLYLRRRTVEAPWGPPGAPDLMWYTYTPARKSLFCEAIARTYTGSRDCPELTGVRTPGEVLAGHRAVGVFEPELWSVALRGDEPVGVVLLNRMRGVSAVEIVYMGVAPAARGSGVGDALLGRAAETVRRLSVEEMALAVDARNDPARRLYARWGFAPTTTRDAWIATLRASST